MNCKQGELAIVCRVTHPDVTPYLGRIVTCLRIDAYGESWFTEPELEPGRAIYDGALRPIRPGDMEDETPTVKELEAV